MIDHLHQHHFCNAIIAELGAGGGEAGCRDAINALAGSECFDLSPEEKLLTDPCGTNKFDHSATPLHNG